MRAWFRVAALGLAAFTVSTAEVSASATALLYQLTGSDSVTFTVDDHPSVAQTGVAYFRLDGINVTTAVGTTPYYLYFFAGASSGGFTIAADPNGAPWLETQGPVLFGGTVSNPALSPGIFALTDYNGSGSYTLRVGKPGAVPEPATWVSLTVGFLLIGGLLRRCPMHFSFLPKEIAHG